MRASVQKQLKEDWPSKHIRELILTGISKYKSATIYINLVDYEDYSVVYTQVIGGKIKTRRAK